MCSTRGVVQLLFILIVYCRDIVLYHLIDLLIVLKILGALNHLFSFFANLYTLSSLLQYIFVTVYTIVLVTDFLSPAAVLIIGLEFMSFMIIIIMVCIYVHNRFFLSLSLSPSLSPSLPLSLSFPLPFSLPPSLSFPLSLSLSFPLSFSIWPHLDVVLCYYYLLVAFIVPS